MVRPCINIQRTEGTAREEMVKLGMSWLSGHCDRLLLAASATHCCQQRVPLNKLLKYLALIMPLTAPQESVFTSDMLCMSYLFRNR
jgi:hypothetical protein